MSSYYEKILATGVVKCIDEEIPFEVPKGWEWTRMGNIGDWGAGATPAKGDSSFYGGDILWLRTGELNDGVVYDTEIKITQKALDKCSLRLNKVGDVLIAMYGATIGKVSIVGKEMTTNQACCACTPYGVYNLFLFYYLMASKEDFIKKGEGGAQPNISRVKLVSHLMPLPPIQEQHRIVNQIKKLLPLIEQYNCTQLQQKKLNSEIIEKLRKSILQEAIQGKLVPQIAEEGTASTLLEYIKEEKQRLVKEGKLKKSALNDSVIFKGDDNKYWEKVNGVLICIDDEIPFEIPNSWNWCRLGDIGKTETGTTPSKSHPEYFGSYIPFIGPANISNSKIISETQGLSKEGVKFGRVVPKHTILQVCIGGSIGKCAIADKPITFNQQLNSITPYLCIAEFGLI